MNERIQNQINNMKNQTIGVEIEMNNITRRKAAEHMMQQANTVTTVGLAKTLKEECGNSKGM